MGAVELTEKALALPERERAELARRLVASLETDLSDEAADVEAAWTAEIEARIGRSDAGGTSESDWREAIDEIRTGLRNGRTGA